MKSQSRTFIDIGQLVFEIHQRGHAGDAVVVGGGGVGDLNKVDPVDVAVIVNVLHSLQHSLGVAGFSVV